MVDVVKLSTRGLRGRRGLPSGPLGDGSVGPDEISNDPGEQAAIMAKLGGLKRDKLTGNRTYYVRTNGSDSNDGLANTAGGAFVTPQKAIDTVYRSLDLNGFIVTIQIADGTYIAPISLRGLPLGATADQPLRMIGNESTPANVIFNTTSANALTLQGSAYLLLAGVTTRTTTAGVGWSVQSNSLLEHRNCRFGAVAGDMILTQHHASVKAIGPTTIAGNAVTFLHATKHSVIDFAAQTLTYDVSIPSFSTYLMGVNDASINLDSATIVNKGSGRILVHDGGSINVSSITGNFLGGFAPEEEEGGHIYYGDVESTRTIYVRTADGNDANDGRFDSAARAFKTISAAINYLAKLPEEPKRWAAGAGWVIQLADGTYTEAVNLRDVPYFDVTLRGNNSTPANVVVSSASDAIIGIGVRTKWNLEGFQVAASSGHGIRAEQNANIDFQNLRFGTCSGAHIYAITGANVRATGNYAIPNNAGYHALARLGGQIDIQNRTVTLSGTPSFTTFALAEMTASIRALNMTFSGTGAAGKRYEANLNGTINTNGGGATYLPGNASGSVATGGQYA
ncbi:hypothetical protein KFK14_11250 [Sphingobium phenoxybenzoativorans]|uniref:Uncharacterized protein n=1 Tax=Sphingobium phenoxybenzoativorans TaxID=1592790 RepID=A0A975KAP8_9SPHN|nr:hypothetical protein [Sphingobium phenoxybenzoativorans]QUT07905.1 hypothetical protein KFK14_11250 [Sphingobium phenoxybenzoativorans]